MYISFNIIKIVEQETKRYILKKHKTDVLFLIKITNKYIITKYKIESLNYLLFFDPLNGLLISHSKEI